MAEPQVRFCTSADGTRIAYTVAGDGPALLFVTAWGATGEHHFSPWLRGWADRMALDRRLAILDRRGTGASQRDVASLALDAQLGDVEAVADHARFERFDLFAVADGAALALAFAARRPERVGRLVLWCPFASGEQVASLPTLSGTADLMERNFPLGLRAYVDIVVPSGSADELRRYREDLHRDTSSQLWPLHYRFLTTLDVRDELARVRAPTLVVQRSGAISIPPSAGRAVAAGVPDAALLVVDGDSTHQSLGDQGYVDAVVEFLDAERRAAPARAAAGERALATALFTDVVGSTEKMAALGDRSWGELIRKHHEIVRHELERFRGREIDTAGDGFFAVFDGPEQALHCACAIGDALRALDVRIRSGIHTGQCEVIDGKPGGIAVHIASRVAALAAPDEVLVSGTVRDLLAGSGIRFLERGVHALRGVPGEWKVFAVERPPG